MNGDQELTTGTYHASLQNTPPRSEQMVHRYKQTGSFGLFLKFVTEKYASLRRAEVFEVRRDFSCRRPPRHAVNQVRRFGEGIDLLPGSVDILFRCTILACADA